MSVANSKFIALSVFQCPSVHIDTREINQNLISELFLHAEGVYVTKQVGGKKKKKRRTPLIFLQEMEEMFFFSLQHIRVL